MPAVIPAPRHASRHAGAGRHPRLFFFLAGLDSDIPALHRHPSGAFPTALCAIGTFSPYARETVIPAHAGIFFASIRLSLHPGFRHNPRMTTDPAEQIILTLLTARGPEKSICPTEAARVLAGNPPGDTWRPSLSPVRLAAMRLARAGKIDILRKGKKISPEEVHGVIRLRLASGTS